MSRDGDRHNCSLDLFDGLLALLDRALCYSRTRRAASCAFLPFLSHRNSPPARIKGSAGQGRTTDRKPVLKPAVNCEAKCDCSAIAISDLPPRGLSSGPKVMTRSWVRSRLALKNVPE